jgi:two-component system sensor histidine kinase MtrB
VASRLPAAALRAPDQPIVVEADVRRIDRIIGNLLDNARSHAPGTVVEVTVAPDGSDAIVQVADRGPGVRPDALEHLFDRFYKTEASRNGDGSGLGLAIAAEHAALLRGDLTAENREAGGLAVTLRLPVIEPLPASDDPDMGEPNADHGSSAMSAPTEPARPNT